MHDYCNVCSKTVAADMCVGCGVCAGICPTGILTMYWTPSGCYQPVDRELCSPKCAICIHACPFLDHEENENTLAAAFFAAIDGISHRDEIGYYLGSYVGYANNGYRERGSSGGMASWILASLLEQGEADRVICVKPTSDPERLYAFDVLGDAEAVKEGSKSAYYPVELSQAVKTVLRKDARYAIIGLPCQLKALRLAMLHDQVLGKRIRHTVGLVCGQMKSKYFASYLAGSLGVDHSRIRSVVFRSKDPTKPASEYALSVSDSKSSVSMPRSNLYRTTWMSGEFSLNACGYCDDIFAEVADVVCMDAWLPAYTPDWKGTSIVVTRSEKMRQLLQLGIDHGSIVLHPIGIDQVIKSQSGVISHKRQQLSYRLWMAQKSGIYVPTKRVKPQRPNLLQEFSLNTRENVRRMSHLAIQGIGGPASSEDYQSRMRPVMRWTRAVLRLRYLAGRVCSIPRRLRRIVS